MKINYLDLFSGVGGFSKGIQEAGIEFGWHGFSEIDKYAISVYRRHFPDAIPLGSITDVSTAGMPNLDLVTFGFPCQDLSIAGKRKGLEGRRSGLFFEAVRIIAETRPRYFVFENVKGLFSSAGGGDFTTVLRTIADIGYDGQWQLLNTSWFLPQNRERVYFVGYPGKGSRPQVFPIGEGDTRDIQASGGTQGEWKRIRGDCASVDSRTGSTARRQHLIAGALAQRDYKGGGNLIQTDRQTIQACLTPNRSQPNSKTRRGWVGVANTLDTQMQQYTPVKNMQIRRLTPIECERLHGFPDDWTRYGHDVKEISDSQRYKMMGNTVSVPVVKAVIKKLFGIIKEGELL